METKNANHSIQCLVTQCQNHCGTEDYCGLDSISVNTHEKNPTVCQCIDCESFVVKNQQ